MKMTIQDAARRLIENVGVYPAGDPCGVLSIRQEDYDDLAEAVHAGRTVEVGTLDGPVRLRLSMNEARTIQAALGAALGATPGNYVYQEAQDRLLSAHNLVTQAMRLAPGED